jgi:hypothetical protein
MALSQTDLDKLDKAIASGVRRVTYSSGTVEYQSLDDMMKARSFIAAQLGSTPASMTSLAEFHR